MCLNLLFTIFGLYVDKFCCYHTSCRFYEHFLISYSMSQTTLLSRDSPFIFQCLKAVENVCSVSFDRNLTFNCWSPGFVSMKETAFFLEKS